MKKVLMPLSPQECERVFNGEQTILVRKRVPKCDTPYEVLVYETKGATDTPWVDEDGHFIYKGRGQVIGSFVCDGIEECIPDYDPYTETFFNYYFESGNDCLTAKEIRAYGKGDPLYGLHITKPKLFDKPKELSEFRVVCHRTIHCRACEYVEVVWHEDEQCFYYECRRPSITHQPRSFCYVEDNK